MNYDDFLRPDRSGKGYMKTDVMNYLDEVMSEVYSLEETLRSLNPSDSYFSRKNSNTILKSTSSSGFVKEDVCNYLDNIQEKLELLVNSIQQYDRYFTYQPRELKLLEKTDTEHSPNRSLGKIISGLFKKNK